MFKFFNMWTSHQDFWNIVQSKWAENFVGTKQYNVCKKLKALKNPLKALNKQHFSHISSKATKAQEDLKSAQLELHQHPEDSQLQSRVVSLQKTAWNLCNAERSFYYQQAKCKYLLNSDKGTKFFHAIVKRNTHQNHIAVVTKADGSPTSSSSEVVQEFLHFYKKLLGTRQDTQALDRAVMEMGTLLNDQQQSDLIRDISDDEIKAAIFGIDEDKSPGLDGYTSCFFKKAWHIVGEEICLAVKEFFTFGSILKQINHTIIALIPKTSHAASVNDYRPISCCNVLYKAISKISTNRLALLLPSIVDRAQSAFIEGRSMTENIHLAQELLKHHGRKRTAPRCLMKIDLCKAYDSVSWNFLKEVLLALNIPLQFVSWVMECVTTTSFSIRINGEIHGFFKGERGLRQGDPLSPFLFVLCLEYLSRALRKATTQSDFNYHPKCAAFGITHLAFADDLMLFAREDIPSVKILMNCLEDFGCKSGLKANMLKSNLYTTRVHGREKEDLQRATGIPLGSMPFRYLGVPLAAEKLKVMHYAHLIEKLADQIGAWKATSLSYASRLELISSVLQEINCFWLSILPVPSTVLDQVTELCKNFL